MFKKHPKGLAVLFFTEMWERFGFYTLMAVFVLYMEKEFDWNDEQKGDLYGIFLGLVYFLPLLGGWLGDRVIGRMNSIRLGGSLMAIGFAALAASSSTRLEFFYIGLFLIALGTGIFKVNISVSIGELYETSDPLKDAGYNIYYMGVNLGATIAPLVATAISVAFGSYQLSFAAASIGMLLSLLIFGLGKKQISALAQKQGSSFENNRQTENEKNQEDSQRIITCLILFTIVIFFWIAFYQNGFALTLFAKRSTIVSEVLRPETYQFFNPFFILLLTPLLVSFFASLRRKGKEPSSATKIFWGMFISGFSMVTMVFASMAGGNLDEKIMSPLWLVGAYFIISVSEIMVSPMGQSFVSKVAPRRIQGVMMGLWFCATAIGSYGSGLLGRFYSSFFHHHYYMIIAGLLFFSSILVIVFRKQLNRFSA
ncbi:MAG: peptide MFS transporter [bacterium]